MKIIVNTFKFIHQNGLVGFLVECHYRLQDKFYEKYFNVKTKGMVSKKELSIDNHESVFYASIHYKHTMNVLNKLPVDKIRSTLLDYGCGKGRIIISAASQEYKKIIGVELSNLITIAKCNVEKMNHKRTNNIELVQCDAQDYKVTPDTNIIYFYNPFKGSILEKVTENIYSSYQENPRKIYIIYFNNDHFDKIVGNQTWLTKITQSTLYQNTLFGLYETVYPTRLD